MEISFCCSEMQEAFKKEYIQINEDMNGLYHCFAGFNQTDSNTVEWLIKYCPFCGREVCIYP